MWRDKFHGLVSHTLGRSVERSITAEEGKAAEADAEDKEDEGDESEESKAEKEKEKKSIGTLLLLGCAVYCFSFLNRFSCRSLRVPV